MHLRFRHPPASYVRTVISIMPQGSFQEISPSKRKLTRKKFAFFSISFNHAFWGFRNVTAWTRQGAELELSALNFFGSSCVEDKVSAGLVRFEMVIRKNCGLVLI